MHVSKHSISGCSAKKKLSACSKTNHHKCMFPEKINISACSKKEQHKCMFKQNSISACFFSNKNIAGIPDIFSKWPHEYPNIAYLGFDIVRSIKAKLPSVYLIQRNLRFWFISISITGGPTFCNESYSTSFKFLLIEFKLNFSRKLS